MEREEGEMSDDNAMIVEDTKEEPNMELVSNHTVLYKADKNGIVFEQLEKIDASKLEERAKRFGLNLSGNRVVTQTQIDELYAKSGIKSGNERHFRFDTLHLNGIEGLTTKEIFEYLEDYKPVSLEKIDDVSCNIVCQDHISAALALLVHSREISNEHVIESLSEKSHHHWREGMPHPKKDLILMRFATNGDKKVPKVKSRKRQHANTSDEYYDQSMDPISKNPWGDLCKSWGVYDHQEVFQRKMTKNDYEDEIEEPMKPVQIRNKKLAMRLGKRSYKREDSEDSSSDSEWKKKSKTPRMRMHADDEESKIKKSQYKKDFLEEEEAYEEKNKYAPLSIEVVNSRSSYTPRETTKLSDKFKRHDKNTGIKKASVQSRLGVKVTAAEEYMSDDGSSESEHNISSKVQKVRSTARTTTSTSVWSRLENKEETSSQNDLRQILKSRKDKSNKDKSDDLRDKIGKSKKSNLRVEIDNN